MKIQPENIRKNCQKRVLKKFQGTVRYMISTLNKLPLVDDVRCFGNNFASMPRYFRGIARPREFLGLRGLCALVVCDEIGLTEILLFLWWRAMSRTINQVIDAT